LNSRALKISLILDDNITPTAVLLNYIETNKKGESMNWYIDVLKKYAVFDGRARRKECWMFFLFNFVIAIVLGLVEDLSGSSSIVSILYSLAVLIPGIAVSVRRLHDTERSGWWLLIALIPIVGVIVLIIFMVQDSKAGENKYGLNPKLVIA